MTYTYIDLDNFVRDCYLKYASKGIEIGDPIFEWHLSHHPVPRWLNGENLVPLLVEDHAIHGVIQSEVFQYPCIWGWENKHLSGNFLKLFEKWRSELGRIAGETGTTSQKEVRKRNGANSVKRKDGIHSPEYRKSKEFLDRCRIGGGRAGKMTGSENVVAMNSHPNTKRIQIENGKIYGSRQASSTNSQKWMCLETGIIANPGNLTKIQKARGVDTSRRVRLTPEEAAFIFLWD